MSDLPPELISTASEENEAVPRERVLASKNVDTTPELEAEFTGVDGAMGDSSIPRLSVEKRNVYGNNMLYVALADGSKVGRVNLRTNKVVLERPDLRAEFELAIADWQAETGGKTVSPLESLSDSVALAPPEVDIADLVLENGAPDGEASWRDLAENRPGESARIRAIEMRQKAPVRTVLARVLHVHTDERAWRVGADGEEEVARRLRALGDSWSVLHAVPIGDRGADIDHVVVGPGGVFTLNSKYHLGGRVSVSGGTVWVNGQRTDYVRKSRFEGERASKLLSAACGFAVAVQPLIVVMASDLRVVAQPSDVYVIGRKRVAAWLSARPIALAPEQVETVFSNARRSTTWIGRK
jgi:hypothetical protein